LYHQRRPASFYCFGLSFSNALMTLLSRSTWRL